jgi:hypothetical protein
MFAASTFALAHETDTLSGVSGVVLGALVSIIVVVLLITPITGAG